MDDVLRVGLAGAGPWANRVHAPGIAAHPRTRLTSVWARRADAAKELADQHGATVAADFDELISSVDAIAFAVPPAVQGELAPAAARAGKHVILEKPLAADLKTAQTVVDAIESSGTSAVLMLTRRFAPEVQDWLEELGDLGGWTGGTGRWLAGGLLSGDYASSEWRQHEGALLDAGPHAIDLLDAALGPIERVRAAHRDRDDLWHVMFGHTTGATSTLALSLRVPVQPALVEFAVYGDHGERHLVGRRTTAQACYAQLLDDFAAMIDQQRVTHPCDARRGLHLQEVLHKVRQAI